MSNRSKRTVLERVLVELPRPRGVQRATLATAGRQPPRATPAPHVSKGSTRNVMQNGNTVLRWPQLPCSASLLHCTAPHGCIALARRQFGSRTGRGRPHAPPSASTSGFPDSPADAEECLPMMDWGRAYRDEAAAANAGAVCDGDGESDAAWEVEVETIAGDSVEMLHAPAGQNHSQPTESLGGSARADGAASPRPHAAADWGGNSGEVVRVLDNFARASIANYVARVVGQPSTAVPSGTGGGSDSGLRHHSEYEVSVREVQNSTGRATQYHAKQRLPLPPVFGERFAEGFGSTEKEAETLTAMHAVRILDALGVPLFQLSSRQRRHADAAKAAGRSAPLPGEPLQPASTPSPRPLLYMAEDTVARMERTLNVSHLKYNLVSHGAFFPFECTLASPFFLDLGSVRRLRQFFQAYKVSMESYAKVTALHSPKDNRAGGSALLPEASKAPTTFLAQLRLPISPRFGDRVCVGKSSTRKEALALACMHAELTIDALGLALFPTDAAMQQTHVAECRQVGRWAASPGDFDYRYTIPSPPPLCMQPDGGTDSAMGARSLSAHRHARSPSNALGSDSHTQLSTTRVPATATAEVRSGAGTVESLLVQHSRAVHAVTRIVDVDSLDESGRLLFMQHLDFCRKYFVEHGVTGWQSMFLSSDPAVSPFFVEVLGPRQHETYRASVTVPLLSLTTASDSPSPSLPKGSTSSGDLPASVESFVAVGIASGCKEAAELAAATHAVRVLAAVSHPVVHSAETRDLWRTFLNSPAADGIPTTGCETLRDLRSLSLRLSDALSGSSPLGLPVRCVGEQHLGRILSPGLASVSQSMAVKSNGWASPSAAGTPVPVKLRDEQRTRDILLHQSKLPKKDWSLDEDADHRIIVDPTATASAGRNYVHTLSAVRSPDVFAVNRLKDYLERHGKRLDTSVAVTSRPLEEWDGRNASTTPAPAQEQRGGGAGSGNELRLYSARCALPTCVRCVAPVSFDLQATASSSAGAPAGHSPASSPAAAATAVARVVAHGEAYSEDDAVLMCAVHFELLLDALGLCLYDHPALQRRHADTARMLGRWAPMAAGAMPPAPFAALPPPVRKEHAQSCLWARLHVQRLHARGGAADRGSTPVADSAKSAEGTGSNLSQQAGGRANAGSRTPCTVPLQRASAAATGNEKPPVHDAPRTLSSATLPASSPSGETPSDEDLCNLAALQHVHPSEVFRLAPKHVQAYYHTRGSDFYRSVRQYTTPTPGHGPVHRAIAEIPVPAAFGRRFAVGCAETKKRALLLCATHAAWTLDALGIPLHQGRRQAEYAKMAELRGRRAAQPGSPTQPPSTPSPRGLCCFVGMGSGTDDSERPEPPTEPSTATVAADERVWLNYVRCCRIYLDKVKSLETQEALFVLNQVPRNGVELEDDGLDLVERLPLGRLNKVALERLCAATGVAAPAIPFRYEVYGRAPNKRFLTEVEVCGTPYTARGFGKTPPESRTRAGMHYEYLLTHVVARNGAKDAAGSPFSPSHSPTAVAGRSQTLQSSPGRKGVEHDSLRRRGHAHLFDAVRGDFTLVGKSMAVALFAATHKPFRPPSLALRERVAAPSREAVHVAVLTLEDSMGLRVSGTGEHASDVDEAVDRALSALFAQLQRRAPFQELMHLIRSFAALQPAAAVCFASAETEQRLTRSLRQVANQLSSPTSASRSARAQTPQRDLATDVVAELSRCECKSLEPTGPSERHCLRSHLSDLLLQLAAAQLRQSAAPPPLTLSANAKDVLPLLGLLRTDAGESAGSSGGGSHAAGAEHDLWTVTAAGVAVAHLVGCLPSLPSPSSAGAPSGETLDGVSAMATQAGPLLPLQLAKVLFCGMLLDCLALACRAVAVVACAGSVWTSVNRQHATQGEAGGAPWRSLDLCESVADPEQYSRHAAGAASEYEAAVLSRLRELSTSLSSSAPSGSLASLLQSTVPPPSQPTSHAPSAPLHEVALLRLCIAAAASPDLWVPADVPVEGSSNHISSSFACTQRKRAAAAGTETGRVFESPDGTRTAVVHPRRETGRNAAAPRQPSSSPASAAATETEVPAGPSGECFFALDCQLRVPTRVAGGDPASRVTGQRSASASGTEHVCLVGVVAAPVVSLAAAVSCANATATYAATDVAEVALVVQGSAAVPARDPALLQCLSTLRETWMLAAENYAPVSAEGRSALIDLALAPTRSLAFYIARDTR